MWRSLGTTRKAEAIRQARIAAYDFEVLLRGEPEARADRPQITAEGGTTAPTAPVTLSPPRPEKTLRELLSNFLTDPAKVRCAKTVMIYENAIPIVGEVLGMDTPIRTIDREGCRRLIEVLRWLPTNSTKRFPKLNAIQAYCSAAGIPHVDVEYGMDQLRQYRRFVAPNRWEWAG